MFEFMTHPVPAVVVLLGVLVLIHEFGHFIVGKLSGIAVEIFSIGFGPVIFKVRRGDTEYQLSWIPLGGYVKFYGATKSEEVPAHLVGQEYYRSPLWRRFLVVAAGPFANFLLAAVAFAVLGFHGIPHPRPILGEIMRGGAAEKVGLQFQDEVVAIDGDPIKTWQDMERKIQAAPNRELKVDVKRNGSVIHVQLTPAGVANTDAAGRTVTIGRAGVARGNLPAVVAVAPKSVAERAGLITGDKIVGLGVGAASMKIQFWREFLDHLNVLLKSGQKEFVIDVSKANVPGQAAIGAATLRTVKLPITTIEKLGFRDAQLVIGETADETKEVFKVGDQILSWNGEPVADVFQLQEQLTKQAIPDAKTVILRAGKELPISLQLKVVEVQRAAGKSTIFTLPVIFLGQAVEPEPWVEIYPTVLSATGFGFSEATRQSKMIVTTIGGLITRDIPLKALGGPMLIAKIAGDSAKLGWQAFLMSMAMISINLAVLNLFPIPVLDGGQLVLMAVEALRRRPLGEVAIENFQKIGFVMVMALVVLATYNDFSRFWTSMLQTVRGVFQ